MIGLRKVRLGGPPKPAREPRALPGIENCENRGARIGLCLAKILVPSWFPDSDSGDRAFSCAGAGRRYARIGFQTVRPTDDSGWWTSQTGGHVRQGDADPDHGKIDIYRQSGPEMDAERFRFVGAAGNARLEERADGAGLLR